MATSDSPCFTIVGAGLGGALMACYLARAGYRVDLYEKRADPRTHPQEGGRSINLAISVRGFAALREVGLEDEVRQMSIPMRGRMMHAVTGETTFQPYGRDDSEAIHSVSRAGLNLTLIQAAARHESVRLFFNKKCVGIDFQDGALDLVDEVTQEATRVPSEIVIAADGAFSAVRTQMQKQLRFNFRQDFESHGYKELSMSAASNGAYYMDKNALHIWPRHSFMMIALPNLDGSFTCTLFAPWDGPNGFNALKTRFDFQRYFVDEFPDARAIMPSYLDDYFANPTGSLVTIRCSPWHVRGKVVLLGDACHAVVPFFGQGMNAAFEDCSILSACLAEHAPDWEKAFRVYEARRKPNTDALAELCIENFLEMRDHVASRAFLLWKKVERRLHKLFPRYYIPLYNLVSFTRVPYAEARRKARRQNRGLAILLAGLILTPVLGLVLLIAWLWR